MVDLNFAGKRKNPNRFPERSQLRLSDLKYPILCAGLAICLGPDHGFAYAYRKGGYTRSAIAKGVGIVGVSRRSRAFRPLKARGKT
jgi:hypothetical protein